MISPKIFLLTLIAAFCIPALSWEFTGWSDPGYSGKMIIDRSGNGFTNNQCYDIIENDNTMSSFQWYRGTNIFCSMSLWQYHECKGEKLASSTGNWNVNTISAINDNRVSSVWVDCL